MLSNVPHYVLSELYENCTTQKQAIAWLRQSGYKFRDSDFRRAWAALAGKRETGYTPSLTPEPALPARPPGRVTALDSAAELVPDEPPLAAGRVYTQDRFRPTLTGNRFVFTAAQNNTLVHKGFFASLLEFCRHRGAKLGVSPITYQIAKWNKRAGNISKKPVDAEDEIWYDACVKPYFIDEQAKVANGLLFCGELDILPTMQNPLNGLDNYTGTNSAIVPHTKMHMRSLATMKHEDAKFLYTTGACTLRNYINRRIGQIASFNHVYGAIYVEIDADGTWFVRQLNADDAGSFYDLDEWFTPAGVSKVKDHQSSSGGLFINLGDIHAEKLDIQAWSATLDMLGKLPVDRVFLHDLLDFTARNHHNVGDPWFMAQNGVHQVQSDIRAAASVVQAIHSTVKGSIHIVQSNHDDALVKWLKTPQPIQDFPNRWYWHQLNAWVYKALEEGVNIDIFKRVINYELVQMYGQDRAKPDFIPKDESFVLREIEFGMHGHLGPNGARGNPAGFRQIGRRANTGHTHSAGIIDGVWTAGVLATLDMGYNHGPSSWSHSHILTYPNGKRSIVTIKKGKWRAED